MPVLQGAVRRNQVLIFGVVLLGILAICLAVSMPSDLEFNDSELPASAGPMSPEVTETSSLSAADSTGKRNQTNSTSRKKTLRYPPEVSVEVKLLRDIAIQKKIQEYYSSKRAQQRHEIDMLKDSENIQFTKEELETVKVNSIVETFVESEDFEDFLIDMEIHNAVKKLREEKGYKSRSSAIFDELYKRAEKEFIGEDEEELHLIRKVGEELEKRARDVINQRRKARGEDLTEPKKLLANELLKFDFSGSGDLDAPEQSELQPPMSQGGDEEKEEVTEIRKTEL